MGFRSTFTTEDTGIKWPEWFVSKYQNTIIFHPTGVGAIHSRQECKMYLAWASLYSDIQKAIDWSEPYRKNLVMVFLHECGGITRCEISKDAILWSAPNSWVEVGESGEHWYCYGCSDVDKIGRPPVVELEPPPKVRLGVEEDQAREKLYHQLLG